MVLYASNVNWMICFRQFYMLMFFEVPPYFCLLIMHLFHQFLQGYEARLFLVKKSNNDSVIASVEEARDLQRRKYELNQFFRNTKTNEGSEPGDDNKNPRSAREGFLVSSCHVFYIEIQLSRCHLSGFHLTNPYLCLGVLYFCFLNFPSQSKLLEIWQLDHILFASGSWTFAPTTLFL